MYLKWARWDLRGSLSLWWVGRFLKLGVQLKKENDIKSWGCVRFLVFVTND